MNKIIVIVVTYNRKKILEECINALLNQTYNNCDILIVDNASTDGTYEEVVKKYDVLKYINTGSNIGGAGGFNRGIKYAIENKYDYAWLMDDDSIVEPDALESVVNKAEKINNNFSFISSLVKWIDNSYCLMNKVTFNNDVILKKYELIKDNMLAIKSASFVGCFINLEIAKKIGLPIKEFFIYADDLEYTLRLSAQNTGYFNSDSVIIHKMSNNVTSEIHCVDESKINRYFYDFRNNVYILLKTKKIIKGFLLSMWRYLKYIIKIIKYAPNKKMKRILVITKGTIYGLFFHPKIEYIK